MKEGKTMGAIYKKKKQVWLLIVVVTMGMVMVAGALLWILSLEGTVTGLWASMMSVVFTFLGVLYALLQWLAQLAEQQGMDKRALLSDASGSQNQSYFHSERLTSHITCSPLTEILSSSTLLSSVRDNPPTAVLKRVCTTDEDEQKSPHSPQRDVILCIHIYPEKRS